MLLHNARWALNNVATFGTPGCVPTLDLVRRNPAMMATMAQSTRLGNMAPDMPLQQMGNALEVCTFLLPPISHSPAGPDLIQPLASARLVFDPDLTRQMLPLIGLLPRLCIGVPPCA